MPELAEVFRRHGSEYRERYAGKILPSQLRAMRDIEHCRTETMGGHAYLCPDKDCGHVVYSYHSCKNRHCPKCRHDDAELWLHKQQGQLLPVPHFLVTATLPAELRILARTHQKIVYSILFKASAAAIIKLAHDNRFIGGEIGMTGVLHTWDKAGGYHPHVHYLVPAGGLSPDRSQWRPAKSKFLIRVELISAIFRAKFRDHLQRDGLLDLVPPHVWQKDWVVHCKHVGSGSQALIYLARYLFRVAITNSRIVAVDDRQVAFRCQDAKSGKWQLKKLPPLTFIHRFLQHVLPKGFQKVRYYGLLSPRKKPLCAVARYILRADDGREKSPTPVKPKPRCPKCGKALLLAGRIAPAPYQQARAIPPGRAPPA